MRSRSKGLSQPAQLGLIALVSLAVVGAFVYGLTTLGPAHAGYRFGVRFSRALGLSAGSQVFMSGVEVGTVQSVSLQPNNAIEVIVAMRGNTDVPRASVFTIQGSLTGAPTLLIAPPVSTVNLSASPTPLPRSDVFPRRVLPADEQPVGRTPPTIEELMSGSKDLTNRSKAILADMGNSKRRLLASLQGVRSNAQATSVQLHALPVQLKATLDSTRDRLSSQVASIRQALHAGDKERAQRIAATLAATSAGMKSTLDSLRSTKNDPAVRRNLTQTAAALKTAEFNVRGLKDDEAAISGSPQTRKQLADAQAQLRAALQRAKSLLKP